MLLWANVKLSSMLVFFICSITFSTELCNILNNTLRTYMFGRRLLLMTNIRFGIYTF